MNRKAQATFEAQAEIMKALAHPTRLFIVQELGRGERCVAELTRMVGADTSTVSKHLSVLKAARIVAVDKRGTSVFYSLKMPCVLKFFGCVDQVLRTNAKRQMQLVR